MPMPERPRKALHKKVIDGFRNPFNKFFFGPGWEEALEKLRMKRKQKKMSL